MTNTKPLKDILNSLRGGVIDKKVLNTADSLYKKTLRKLKTNGGKNRKNGLNAKSHYTEARNQLTKIINIVKENKKLSDTLEQLKEDVVEGLKNPRSYIDFTKYPTTLTGIKPEKKTKPKEKKTPPPIPPRQKTKEKKKRTPPPRPPRPPRPKTKSEAEKIREYLLDKKSKLPKDAQTTYSAYETFAPISVLYALKETNNDCGLIQSTDTMRDNFFKIIMTQNGKILRSTIPMNIYLKVMNEGIQRCKKINKIPVMPVVIQEVNIARMPISSHSNMLIFNWKRNEIERYEPHNIYSDNTDNNDDINKYILKNVVYGLNDIYDYKFKYVSPDISCPVPIQSFENTRTEKIIGYQEGYCTVIASFYTLLRLKYPTLSQKDILISIDEISESDPNIIMKMIVNYSNYLEKTLKEWNYYDSFKKVIDSSGEQIENSNLRDFTDKIYEKYYQEFKKYTDGKDEKLSKIYNNLTYYIKNDPEQQTIIGLENFNDKFLEVFLQNKKFQNNVYDNLKLLRKNLDDEKNDFNYIEYKGSYKGIKRQIDLLTPTIKAFTNYRSTYQELERFVNNMMRISDNDKKYSKKTMKNISPLVDEIIRIIVKSTRKHIKSESKEERKEREKKEKEKDKRLTQKGKLEERERKQEERERKKKEKQLERERKKREKREERERKKREKKESKPKRKRVKAERKKADIDKNSIYAQYTVAMLNDIIKDHLGLSKGLYLMNKGYKIQLLEKANIDKSLLPDPPVRGMRTYGISRGLVKPYNETEQERFMASNYDELHPLMAKKLDPKKHKLQYEMNIKINLNPHQKKFIVNFINSYFRGGLMFHTVGAGKTLTAVAFSHYYLSLFPDRNVCIISPPTLLFNFVEAMKEYGLDVRDSRYQFHTYIKFSKNYDNIVNDKTLLIIDEIHNFRTFIQYGLREIDGENKKVAVKGMLNEKIIRACQRCRKVLGMTGTPFVNKLYDIENQMAMINRRGQLYPTQFNKIVEDDNMTYDYFKYRISHFDIFKTDKAKFFPEKREEFVKIVLPNIPPFKRIYELTVRGDNPYKDDAKEAQYHEKYLTDINYYTPDGKVWTNESKESGILESKYAPAPEMDFYGRLGHMVLQTVQKEDDEGNKLSAKQLKEAPRVMAKGEQLKSFYNAGRQFGNIIDGLKIKFIIKKLEENPTYKSIVFSSFIQSSLVPLRRILTEKKIKFTLITGSESALTRQKNKEKFNDINSDIRVLLISSAGTEGVSTKNVRQLFVFESQWNEALTEQAIARAIRFKSHNGLPADQNFCNIYRLQLVDTQADSKAVDNFNSGVFKTVAVEFIKLGQERNRLEESIFKEIKEKYPSLYSRYRSDNEREQRQLHRQGRPGIGQKKAPYEFSNERFKNYAVSKYITIPEVIEKAKKAGARGIIYRYMEILKKLENSDKKNDITQLKTLSADIALTKISILKEVIITNFIKDLDNKVPQLESFKEPMHEALIKAIDDEKDVSKLLQKQREILDEIGDSILEETKTINNMLIESNFERNKKLQTTKEKMESVSKYNEFFTPPEIVAEALSYSVKIKSKDYIKVLEPTAGFGNFVRGVLDARTDINDKGTHIDMVEINDKNRDVLQTLYVDSDPYQFNLMETKNFLKFIPQENYDLIVMNPPFHLKHSLNRATINRDMYDIDFVKRAYNMLNGGGELIGVVSSYLSHGKTGNKNWIEKYGVEVLKEYRDYKWSPTMEKEEKGKKSTKLKLNFDIIRIVKPENAVLEPPKDVIINPEPEPEQEEQEQKRKTISTRRSDPLYLY